MGTLTLDEAIRNLTLFLQNKWQGSAKELDAAIKLGIEALKRCRDYRRFHIGLHYTPMPGETEEPKETGLSRDYLDQLDIDASYEKQRRRNERV